MSRCDAPRIKSAIGGSPPKGSKGTTLERRPGVGPRPIVTILCTAMPALGSGYIYSMVCDRDRINIENVVTSESNVWARQSVVTIEGKKEGAHDGRSGSVVVVVSLSATHYERVVADEQVVASGRRRAGRSGMKPSPPLRRASTFHGGGGSGGR